MPLKLHRQGYDNLINSGADEDRAFERSSLIIIKDGVEHTLDTVSVDNRTRTAEFEYFTTNDEDEEPYSFTLTKDQLEQLDWFAVRAGWFGKDDVELALIAEKDVVFHRADIKKIKE